jgi:hypothetical protein
MRKSKATTIDEVWSSSPPIVRGPTSQTKQASKMMNCHTNGADEGAPWWRRRTESGALLTVF